MQTNSPATKISIHHGHERSSERLNIHSWSMKLYRLLCWTYISCVHPACSRCWRKVWRLRHRYQLSDTEFCLDTFLQVPEHLGESIYQREIAQHWNSFLLHRKFFIKGWASIQNCLPRSNFEQSPTVMAQQQANFLENKEKCDSSERGVYITGALCAYQEIVWCSACLVAAMKIHLPQSEPRSYSIWVQGLPSGQRHSA